MKYKTINGWTKAKMLEVIRARPFDEPASSFGSCVYLAPNGNKCGVGLFLPEGHPSQSSKKSVSPLVNEFQDLIDLLPLGYAGLARLQAVHDRIESLSNFGNNAKAAMIHFVETEVYDE